MTAGLALGGGALIFGAITPAALSTENRPFIYITTGGAALLGVGGFASLTIANVREMHHTTALMNTSRGLARDFSLHVAPGGVSGTW